MHPFGCEARAYGRLREQCLEHVAAQCYGYIMLEQTHQRGLREKDSSDWELDWGYEPCHEGMPLKAIVKEFLDPKLEVGDDQSPGANRRRIEIAMKNRKMGSNLVRHLKALHRNGILLRDINIGNILNGLYIDFSRAWTCPHPAMTIKQMENQETLQWYEQGYSDAGQLDKLIDVWNKHHDFSQKIWTRARRNYKYTRGKLRSHDVPKEDRKRKWDWKVDGWRIMPARFNWKLAARKRLEATGIALETDSYQDKSLRKKQRVTKSHRS